MHLETSPSSTEAPRGHWIKIASVANKITKNNTRFFYIGQTEEAIQALSLCFISGTVVDNFAEAQQLIAEKGMHQLQFDVIFIDVPLYKTELETFCRFLKENNLLIQLPLIYNERKLDFSNIKLLRSLQLIDDVVDLTSDNVDYCNKISFIKKLKSQIALKASTSRASVYGINTEALRLYASKQISSGKKIFSFKRLLDIILATLALVILSPVFLLIAICIKFTSKGPIFYTSPRAGQGFKVFDFYKFRTMEVDADKKIEACRI